MRTEIDLNECEIDLNKCEHFLKVNWDRSDESIDCWIGYIDFYSANSPIAISCILRAV